jgi:hypothetical protein
MEGLKVNPVQNFSFNGFDSFVQDLFGAFLNNLFQLLFDWKSSYFTLCVNIFCARLISICVMQKNVIDRLNSKS